MLTAKEAAPLLGLKPRTLYALAAAGKIACHRLGVGDGALRFELADIEAYKTACRSPATTRAAGSTSSTARFPELDGSALTSYFQKAGREPKPKRSTSTKQPVDTRLKLAYSESRG